MDPLSLISGKSVSLSGCLSASPATEGVPDTQGRPNAVCDRSLQELFPPEPEGISSQDLWSGVNKRFFGALVWLE